MLSPIWQIDDFEARDDRCEILRNVARVIAAGIIVIGDIRDVKISPKVLIEFRLPFRFAARLALVIDRSAGLVVVIWRSFSAPLSASFSPSQIRTSAFG